MLLHHRCRVGNRRRRRDCQPILPHNVLRRQCAQIPSHIEHVQEIKLVDESDILAVHISNRGTGCVGCTQSYRDFQAVLSSVKYQRIRCINLTDSREPTGGTPVWS